MTRTFSDIDDIGGTPHLVWVALADMYDDGGLSGGTMERPALKRLLEDITSGKVQIVVVYKVDRLTRSLADFAKIVAFRAMVRRATRRETHHPDR